MEKYTNEMYKYVYIIIQYFESTNISAKYRELSNNIIACLAPCFQIGPSGNIHGKTQLRDRN